MLKNLADVGTTVEGQDASITILEEGKQKFIRICHGSDRVILPLEAFNKMGAALNALSTATANSPVAVDLGDFLNSIFRK